MSNSRELEADPEAMEEFQEAAEDFVRENGYQTRSYSVSPDYYAPYWLSRNHVPYVYWYGYPYWYDQPFWYPHAYWFQGGFYYGPDHGLVIFDFPSWYFMDWYFVWGHHHYYYPHLTNSYLRYHDHHRQSTTAATRVIGEWESANRNQYTRDWLREDPDRVNRIRSYGARETQRQRTMYEVPTVRNETPNRPVYTAPSRNPQTPDRVIRQAPTRPEGIRPAPTRPTRPTPAVRTNPVKPQPQVSQATRYHQEKLVKRKR